MLYSFYIINAVHTLSRALQSLVCSASTTQHHQVKQNHNRTRHNMNLIFELCHKSRRPRRRAQEFLSRMPGRAFREKPVRLGRRGWPRRARAPPRGRLGRRAGETRTGSSRRSSPEKFFLGRTSPTRQGEGFLGRSSPGCPGATSPGEKCAPVRHTAITRYHLIIHSLSARRPHRQKADTLPRAQHGSTY